MSTPSYGDPSGAAPSTEPGAKQQAKDAAGTAADEGKHVASAAKDEAQRVTGEARQQAADLMSQARSQLEEQSRAQRDRLVGTLRTLTDDLEKMAAGEGSSGGMAADMARQVAGRARSFTDQVEGREPAELFDEVRGLARRRPGMFLLGALAAGVITGRLARGAKEASSGTAADAAPYDDAATGSVGTPVADVPVDEAPPRASYSTSRPSPTYPAAPVGDVLHPADEPTLAPGTTSGSTGGSTGRGV